MSGIDAGGPAIAGLPFRTLARQMEKLAPCQAQCPNSGDIRGWLGIIAQHEKNGLTLDEAYDRAWAMLVERNPLPASIGRICPHPCEDLCSRADKDGAVSINAMERFLGDWGIKRALPLPAMSAERQPESVGVIGSGPASLSFAYQMARRGYPVTVYEKRDSPGGMLRHAIPDYRLPRHILDSEVRRLFDMGVSLVLEVEIGSDLSLDQLRERHQLVFLGLGAQAARHLGIPGEQGPHIVTGIEYLRQRKEDPETLAGRRVIVVGGGNTAIDAARSARRDGADVTLVYRRSEAEMPAAAHEVADARKEGVEFRFLAAPTRIVREGSALRYLETQRMRLGAPDEEGRRRPVALPGELERLPADRVIVAVSQAPQWQGLEPLGDGRRWLHTAEDGRLDERIWAGGDDRGPGIASQAIAQGRRAAEAAHAELRGLPREGLVDRREAVRRESVKKDYYAARPRAETPRRPEDEWLTRPEEEIDRTLDYQTASAEAARCMSCGLCFDCQQCFMYCNAAGFTRLEETGPGHYFTFATEACEGCGKCIEICPCGFLEARPGE